MLARKPFAWSFSRLKNYEACPKRHQEVDLLKNFREEESEALTWGNQVHASMKEFLLRGTALPDAMVPYGKWALRVLDRPGAKTGGLVVEQSMAITKGFQKTSFFAPDVWFRLKLDYAVIDPPAALAGDWKTGKILEDSVQLALTAQTIFVYYPEVQKVVAEYIWLKEDCRSKEVFERADMADMWTGLFARVEAMEQSYLTGDYPAIPGNYCRRYCPVRTCPFHGKDMRR